MRRVGVALAGLRDGWAAPYDLMWSTSVGDGDQELLDGFINVGQFLRGGLRSQPVVEGWWRASWVRLPAPPGVQWCKRVRRATS